MVQTIDSLDDPRVWHYRSLKDRLLDRSGRWFIAEGEHVVRRLLASDFPVESVFLAEKHVPAVAPLVPAGVPVYAARQALMEGVLGFKFHSGVVACGRRKPTVTIDEVVPEAVSGSRSSRARTCPTSRRRLDHPPVRRVRGRRTDPRRASHDPFWRQSVRVSMGTVFSLPIVHTTTSCATSAAAGGVGRRTGRHGARRRGRAAVARGPGRAVRHLVRQRGARASTPSTSPPATGGDDPDEARHDSLNVAVAAGIFLYHFTRDE
jgi:hypothetical protein